MHLDGSNGTAMPICEISGQQVADFILVPFVLQQARVVQHVQQKPP
jgi:hypothetical protein